jgi:glycosyltransferase involved in cell wall biosynthesis
VIIENKEKLEGRAMFYIGGKGETEKLIRIIHKNNLNKIVKFIGWVSGKKKIECLNKTDVFILPSYYEGLSISILEAMSYGLPIISTCVGGTPEIVEDKKNGLLIDPGNKLQLLDAIFYALKNQKELQNYGVVSKRKVTKNLPANVKKELLKLYHFISNN